MMYIAGETQDVSTPTIKLIEDIIRDQVVHIVRLWNWPLLPIHFL